MKKATFKTPPPSAYVSKIKDLSKEDQLKTIGVQLIKASRHSYDFQAAWDKSFGMIDSPPRFEDILLKILGIETIEYFKEDEGYLLENLINNLIIERNTEPNEAFDLIIGIRKALAQTSTKGLAEIDINENTLRKVLLSFLCIEHHYRLARRFIVSMDKTSPVSGWSYTPVRDLIFDLIGMLYPERIKFDSEIDAAGGLYETLNILPDKIFNKQFNEVDPQIVSTVEEFLKSHREYNK